MKFIAIFALLATTALAIPVADPIEGIVRKTPAEIRRLLEARQVVCLCVEGEWCCEFECVVDPSCG